MSKTYNSTENLGCQQRLDILGREEQRGPGIDEHQAHDDSPAVSETLRDPAVDKEANELADVGTLGGFRVSVCILRAHSNLGAQLRTSRRPPRAARAVPCRACHATRSHSAI